MRANGGGYKRRGIAIRMAIRSGASTVETTVLMVSGRKNCMAERDHHSEFAAAAETI
jgi:hypothetical protein